MDTRKHLGHLVAKVLPHYIHNRNHISKGNGEFTFLRHPIQMVLLAKIAYDWLPVWACVILVVAYLSICKIWGWFWDKNKGYDVEAAWGNKRNPFCKTVEEKLNGSK